MKLVGVTTRCVNIETKNMHTAVHFDSKIKVIGVMMGYLPLQSPALYLHDGDGASLRPF